METLNGALNPILCSPQGFISNRDSVGDLGDPVEVSRALLRVNAPKA